MALGVDFEFSGMNVTAGYVRVIGPAINPDKETMVYTVSYHANRDAPPLKVETVNTGYSLVGGNPFQQAYAWLKTQPAFASATDLLDDGEAAP